LVHEAGVPAGALACLPGLGPEVGAHLARHPEVSFVAFTGSLGVGLELLEGAGRVPPGQHIIKRVVAEMGGKNAIIVDDDADLDEAVRGIMTSAFGFQGQKCSAASRVVALDGIYDRLAERLAGAVRDLRAGPPADPGSDIGPLINRAALEKVRHYIELGRTQGRVLAETAAAPEEPAGWFAAPVLLDGLPEDSALLADEIFGPVLVLQRARSFAEALQLASHQRYRLTGGLYSRHPEHISRARREFQVGNLYINRPITGAIVQRQPFGGLRLSGSGFKAGGPDYLLQFMDTRTISENVLRQGFAPVTRGFFGGNGGGVE
ncbi:MAG: aldehyde dehydrogenase family protein, partial [Deltaproteobacteria bacterium]|nr:aldehyde dehydrogenase family protein [Deltaproteobacteria bacterium]